MLHLPKDRVFSLSQLSYWEKCDLDMGQHPKCKLVLKEAVQWTGFSGFLSGYDWLPCERSYGEQTILSDHLIPILSHGILSAAQEFMQCQTNAIRSKQLMINLFPDQFWKKTLKLITNLRIILWRPKDKLQTKPFFSSLLLKRLYFLWGCCLWPVFQYTRIVAVLSPHGLCDAQIHTCSEKLFSFRPCTR